jgi:hypothetical protein
MLLHLQRCPRPAGPCHSSPFTGIPHPCSPQTTKLAGVIRDKGGCECFGSSLPRTFLLCPTPEPAHRKRPRRAPAIATPFGNGCAPLYLQPLSLIFSTLRSSTLLGQDTAVDERHYGPDWRCGTLLGQASSWAKYTAPVTALGSPVLCKTISKLPYPVGHQCRSSLHDWH